MIQKCLKGGTFKVHSYDQILAMYISQNNSFTLRVDCLCYSHLITLLFGYVYIAIVFHQSTSSYYFYLKKCTHRKLISYIFGIPNP